MHKKEIKIYPSGSVCISEKYLIQDGYFIAYSNYSENQTIDFCFYTPTDSAPVGIFDILFKTMNKTRYSPITITPDGREFNDIQLGLFLRN